MGNNEAFSSFEASVLACYNKGVLDKALLKALAKPYEDCDIDTGGMAGTLSKPVVGPDGVARRLDVMQIIGQVWTGKPPEPAPKLPKDTSKWTPEEERLNEAYWERRDAAFWKFRQAMKWG